jgi:F0F1-type ATP synthase assembly protein I
MTDDQNSGSKSTSQSTKESELEKTAKSFRSGWAYAEYAVQYGVTIVLCTLIGYWLDNWLHTGNVLLIIGVFFGSFAGFVYMLKSLNRKKK